jgi:thiamine biosynthesis lipoprotein
MDMKSISRLRPALGTFVAVECWAADEQAATNGLAAAFAAIETVQRLMHPTRSGSDLVAIRQALPDQQVLIHPWTAEVLALSLRVHALSEGLFDPCLPEMPGRMVDVELAAGAVICRAPVAIDLGGIAKGYAVDRAIGALKSCGCSAGVVNAGGDLRVFGDNPYLLTLRTSRGSHALSLREGACAVSDPAANARPIEHSGYYRRNTPVSRQPAQLPAIVLAAEAAVADALTKCVLFSSTVDERRTLQATLATLNASLPDQGLQRSDPRRVNRP